MGSSLYEILVDQTPDVLGHADSEFAGLPPDSGMLFLAQSNLRPHATTS